MENYLLTSHHLIDSGRHSLGRIILERIHRPLHPICRNRDSRPRFYIPLRRHRSSALRLYNFGGDLHCSRRRRCFLCCSCFSFFDERHAAFGRLLWPHHRVGARHRCSWSFRPLLLHCGVGALQRKAQIAARHRERGPSAGIVGDGVPVSRNKPNRQRGWEEPSRDVRHWTGDPRAAATGRHRHWRSQAGNQVQARFGLQAFPPGPTIWSIPGGG